MSLDLKVADQALSGLRPFPSAITSVSGGRANGLISLSAGNGSVVFEAPRMTVGLTNYNLTHDMVLESGVFAMHLLSAEPDAIDASMAIFMALGGTSGRDGDKLSGLATRAGETGVPILTDALLYLECRVVRSMDCDESTLFLADVVAAERLRTGARLDIGTAWSKLPPDWIATYNENHHAQVEHCRARRSER